MPRRRPDLAVVHDVPLAQLVPHPENARRGDVAAIARSLTRLGQYRPLVVSWRTMHVCAGNHTLAAAALLEWGTIKVVYVTATAVEERAILLADNRIPDLGGDDPVALTGLLTTLADDESLLAATGYTTEDVSSLLAELNRREFSPNLDPDLVVALHDGDDVERARERMDGQYAFDRPLRETMCPECGHEFYVD